MFDKSEYVDKLKTAKLFFEDELKKIRTGRAHSSMLDNVKVEVYGTLMPLNQVANVTAPEAQMLLISPFDPANITAISTAIRSDHALDLNPSDDGRVIRVPLPPLTEERRKSLVKQASEKLEEARVAIRNIRHDALKEIKHLKDAKELSEDEARREEKDFDKLIADMQKEFEDLFKQKEKDILTI